MKKILNLITRLIFIRKLNQTFTGTRVSDFTSQTKGEKLFLTFFFSNNKRLLIVTPKPPTIEGTTATITFIKSVIEVWSKIKINGFSFIDFSLKDTISFLEKERERKILKIKLLEKPKIT